MQISPAPHDLNAALRRVIVSQMAASLLADVMAALTPQEGPACVASHK